MRYLDCSNSIHLCGIITTDPKLLYTSGETEYYGFDISVERKVSRVKDVLPVMCKKAIIPEGLSKGMLVALDGDYCVYTGTHMLEMLGVTDKKAAYKVFAKHIEIRTEPESASSNQMKLKGYLLDVSPIRETQSGDKLVDAVVLYRKDFVAPNGDVITEKYRINCIVWNDEAEKLVDAEWMQKVSIWGKLQSRPYTKVLENGDTFNSTAYELSAGSLWFIS